jgi:SNF2 family DNA or RNA helicase
MMAYQKGRVVWHDFSTPTEDGLANEGVQGSGAVSADGMKVPALAPNTSARSGTLSEQRLLSTEDLNWEDSGKLVVLSQVLPDWHREGHKVLLFSQTQSMLNTVEELLKQLKCNYLRLDGSTPINRRGGLIDQFNDKNGDVFAMLLTTRAGKYLSFIGLL